MFARRTFLAVAAASFLPDLGGVLPKLGNLPTARAQEMSPSSSDFGICVCFGKGKGLDPTNLIRRYPHAVLDTGAFPSAPLSPFVARQNGAAVQFQERYAYFGIAVNTNNPAYKALYQELETKKLLLMDNKKPVVDEAGAGSYFADFRNPAARKVMVKHAVLMAKKPGYTGIFIDATDSAIALENKDPVKYAGLVKGVVAFFEELQTEFQNVKLVRPDAKTKYSPAIMSNGGFATFTADKTFDPLTGMTTASEGRILIESQFLDDSGAPRNEPLDFTTARLTVAAKAAKEAGKVLQVAFVEPRAKDPTKKAKEYEADAIACRKLAEKLCETVATATGAKINAKIHMAHGNYVEPTASLVASDKLAFPPALKK